MTEHVRVLLLAEACNPEWTSVPLVGWSHSRAISNLTDAHLVTQLRNRDAILRAAADLAEIEYRTDPKLIAFEAFGKEDLYGERRASADEI